MKYIKLFEIKRSKRENFNTFFFIPHTTVELVELAIKKLDIDDKVKNEIIKDGYILSGLYVVEGEECGGVYIGILPEYNTDANYEYWICTLKNDVPSGYNEYIRDGYIYGGEIRVEDYEITAIRYNI
jgi:hypothetical protein